MQIYIHQSSGFFSHPPLRIGNSSEKKFSSCKTIVAGTAVGKQVQSIFQPSRGRTQKCKTSWIESRIAGSNHLLCGSLNWKIGWVNPLSTVYNTTKFSPLSETAWAWLFVLIVKFIKNININYHNSWKWSDSIKIYFLIFICRDKRVFFLVGTWSEIISLIIEHFVVSV